MYVDLVGSFKCKILFTIASADDYYGGNFFAVALYNQPIYCKHTLLISFP